MPNSMTIPEFVNACEHRLRRAESFIKQPLKLQTELEELDRLLRSQWPDAIIAIKDGELAAKDRETIELIFKKIKKLEIITKTRVSLFDGIEDFMQQPRNR